MTTPISRRTFTLGLAAGAAAAALPTGAATAGQRPASGITGSSATAAAPFFAETTLWDKTVDPLESYHVHALAVLPDDTIVACTEGRHERCDAGPHDLLIRRSTDGGATWLPSQAVEVAENGETWSNPTFVVDGVTGELFFFYNNCARLPENTSCSADSSIVYLRSSTDGGATWSDRRSLEGVFDGFPYDWEMHGPGPGHGTQLASGRLLLPVSHRTIIHGVPTEDRNYGVSILYSDDHGATWHAAGEVPMGVSPTLGECRLVERTDGTVLMNGRPGSGQDWPRAVSVSTDGGLTWSLPRTDHSAGLFNGVDTGLVRLTGGPGSDDVDRVLFSHPDSPMRWNMTVSVSYDECHSFRYSRSIAPIRGYYSDLAHLSDGTIVLLYGCDGDIAGSPERVAVARFNLEWLTHGRDSLATGPRLAEHTVDLARRGRVTGGSVGVVREETARGGARAVFTPGEVGDRLEYDFTVARDDEYELWLRYFRPADGGLVTMSVDRQTPRTSTLDLTGYRSDGYDVALLDRMRLGRGRHTIRFAYAGPGRGGGAAISLDELSLVQSRTAPDVREEFVVDNGAGLGFESTGEWRSSRAVPGYYGFNYATHTAGDGSAVARWRPALPGDDSYEVRVSFAADSNRATNATYVVHHADGVTPVVVNQQIAGEPDPRMGDWVSLGTFRFGAGIDHHVELSNAADRVVIADAVRFVRAASGSAN